MGSPFPFMRWRARARRLRDKQRDMECQDIFAAGQGRGSCAFDEDYRPPFPLFNGHLQTIVPNTLRRVGGVVYRRERIFTADDDFLDLDWSLIGAGKLAIVSHGLEGNSRRPHVLGMVKALNAAGWDALAWNFRGCSGQLNRKLRFYHAGATDDLGAVVSHALSRQAYEAIVLVGFSLGGNLVLKYLGEGRKGLSPRIRKAAVFSVPCDLRAGAVELDKWRNGIYRRRFFRTLKGKVREKAALMPGLLSAAGLDEIRTLRDFDQRYTAPLHGFGNAEDYWRRNSSLRFLAGIRVPTLIVNARNDPLLGEGCYPVKAVEGNPCLLLKVPRQGGHVGFPGAGGPLWSERQAVSFFARSG